MGNIGEQCVIIHQYTFICLYISLFLCGKYMWCSLSFLESLRQGDVKCWKCVALNDVIWPWDCETFIWLLFMDHSKYFCQISQGLWGLLYRLFVINRFIVVSHVPIFRWVVLEEGAILLDICPDDYAGRYRLFLRTILCGPDRVRGSAQWSKPI